MSSLLNLNNLPLKLKPLFYSIIYTLVLTIIMNDFHLVDSLAIWSDSKRQSQDDRDADVTRDESYVQTDTAGRRTPLFILNPIPGLQTRLLNLPFIIITVDLNSSKVVSCRINCNYVVFK